MEKYFKGGILLSKGKSEGQIVCFILSFIYSYVSYKNKYYGETIVYIFIMLPMSVYGIISWTRNKDEKTDTIEVRKLAHKEIVLVIVATIIAFVVLYYLLKFLNTSELIISTNIILK